MMKGDVQDVKKIRSGIQVGSMPSNRNRDGDGRRDEPRDRYIEVYYKNYRLHEANSYKTPSEYLSVS